MVAWEFHHCLKKLKNSWIPCLCFMVPRGPKPHFESHCTILLLTVPPNPMCNQCTLLLRQVPPCIVYFNTKCLWSGYILQQPMSHANSEHLFNEHWSRMLFLIQVVGAFVMFNLSCWWWCVSKLLTGQCCRNSVWCLICSCLLYSDVFINAYIVNSHWVSEGWILGTALVCHFFLNCHTCISALTAHHCYLLFLHF